MKQTIYKRDGIRVVATGTLSVVLPSGLVLPETFPISEVADAVAFADELAATLDLQQAA